MAYIGKTPTVGNFVKLDALTASATASYTMQVDSVNFSPESVNHMLVSLNGVIQAPTTSYTISGSTITFASALTSSDSIDFIMVYGNVLDIGTPSDATVTNAKTNFVSTSSAAGLQIKGDGTTDGTLQLNCSQNSHGVKIKSPAHSASASYTLTLPTTDGNADEFLKTDGSGVLSWAEAGGGLTLVGSGTGSSVTNINIDSVFSTSYKAYKFVGGFRPATNGSDLWFVFRSGGSNSGNSEYRYIVKGFIAESSGDSEARQNAWGNSYWKVSTNGASNNSNYMQYVDMNIMNPMATGTTFGADYTSSFGTSMLYTGSSQVVYSAYAMNYQTAGNYDGLHVTFSSGNINSYNYQIYGYNPS